MGDCDDLVVSQDTRVRRMTTMFMTVWKRMRSVLSFDCLQENGRVLTVNGMRD